MRNHRHVHKLSRRRCENRRLEERRRNSIARRRLLRNKQRKELLDEVGCVAGELCGDVFLCWLRAEEAEEAAEDVCGHRRRVSASLLGNIERLEELFRGAEGRRPELVGKCESVDGAFYSGGAFLFSERRGRC